MARFQLIQLFAIFAAFFVACANGAATFGAAKAVEPSTDANAENSTSDAGLPSLVLEGAKAVNLTMINEGVKANESIDVQNDNGWSAAIFAVNGNHLDILEGVITLKIDLNIQDKEGYTALHYASSKVWQIK
jgi:ankyrin repeat protein